MNSNLLDSSGSSLTVSETIAHLLLHLATSHHGAWLFECTLKLLVSILLDSLSILQFLDKLHFQLFHLHNFVLLLWSNEVFINDFLIMGLLYIVKTTVSILFNLDIGNMLLLLDYLVFHSIFLLNLELLVSLLGIILLLDHLWLFSFFLLAHVDGILNLSLFFTTILLKLVVLLSSKFLLLIGHLIVVDFLNNNRHTCKHHWVRATYGNEHTFCILSSFLFLRLRISLVLFLVSSIFFHVLISSCLSSAIRLANRRASLSMLPTQ